MRRGRCVESVLSGMHTIERLTGGYSGEPRLQSPRCAEEVHSRTTGRRAAAAIDLRAMFKRACACW